MAEPNPVTQEAVGPIPSASKQQQKEQRGGASGCRHCPAVGTSELHLLELHTVCLRVGVCG